MRIILYTGKEGVGKTSVAAASTLRAAELAKGRLLECILGKHWKQAGLYFDAWSEGI